MEKAIPGGLIIKDRKLIFMIFTLACFIAAGVCLIVNFAVNGRITWAAYPLLSVAFGWAVLSPLLIKKYGIMLFLSALTLLSIPYLYFISQITPVTDWFVPIALPSAVAGLASLWIIYPLFWHTGMNAWYKSAITVFLLGVVVSSIVNYFVDIYVGDDPFAWTRYINLLSCTVASAVVGIVGYMKSKAKQIAEKK